MDDGEVFNHFSLAQLLHGEIFHVVVGLLIFHSSSGGVEVPKFAIGAVKTQTPTFLKISSAGVGSSCGGGSTPTNHILCGPSTKDITYGEVS